MILDFQNYMYICLMVTKGRYNFRLDKDLMEFVKYKAKRNKKTVTAYLEDALKKISEYKEKELV